MHRNRSGLRSMPRRREADPASAYWGDEKIWSQRANNHNGMFDKQGRVWSPRPCVGSKIRLSAKGIGPSSAKVFPLDRSGRQVSMLDPKTMKYSFIDTCFGTYHPQFGYDADDTLWLGHRPGRRLGQHQDVGRDRRRRQGAGLGPVRARHQRQRQSRRMDRAGPAGGRRQGQADRGLGSLRRDAAPDRRLGLVHPQRVRRHAGVPALRSEDQAQ